MSGEGGQALAVDFWMLPSDPAELARRWSLLESAVKLYGRAVEELIEWVGEQGAAGRLVTLGRVDVERPETWPVAAYRPILPALQRSLDRGALTLLADKGLSLRSDLADPVVRAARGEALAAGMREETERQLRGEVRGCPGSGSAGLVEAVSVGGRPAPMVRCGACGQHFAIEGGTRPDLSAELSAEVPQHPLEVVGMLHDDPAYVPDLAGEDAP